ncbi:alpha/beta hydrolase [Streptomyces minutiscleroticus]|uniref:BD-FAE-like domain-containing protein n=1 Tax=Streptomyces minutiscleroticus TaxID=68238 RepID=A0A918NRB6_9ACTN|nr:alpha/beta hydrolase [Streptomyces minutiscleroticus]GGX89694.1 hypothetical protein GCM10010358_49550 [Streptomyces minutiscleroticus]
MADAVSGGAPPAPPRELIAAPHPDAAPLPRAAEHPSGVRVLRGVPYREVPGSRPLELDLWLPPAASPARPAPLVVFVHGGGWRRGRRDDMGLRLREWEPGPFERIAAAGLAVACVDYRLSGEAVFPAQTDDLRAALRWLALRGPAAGVDAGRFVVWGESAGGHLASLLALDRTAPRAAGAVVWYAPGDLTAPRGGPDPRRPDSPEALLLGGAPAALPERAREASPLAHVHAGAPPFLLLHGAGDTMVDPSHSTSLAAALREAGVPVELETVPGADHVWYGLGDAEVEDLFARSLRFAARLLATADGSRA